MKNNHIGVKKEIQFFLEEVLKRLNLPKLEFTIEHPTNESYGDFSSNIAMQLFGFLKKSGDVNYSSPQNLAEEIVVELQKSNSEIKNYIEKISVEGLGFINFYLNTGWLVNQLSEIIKNPKEFGKNKSLKNKKISVEYTDPNPFKEFHIGHLYSNIVGESIATTQEALGATVWRGDFFGDVGMHVAKSIWGLLKKFEDDDLTIENLAEKELKERIEYFGQAYARGATAYKEDEVAQEEIKLLNFLIFKAAQEAILPEYDKKPEINFDQFIQPSKYDYEEIKQLYTIGREWSLAYFETIYKRLGTKFDGYYPESLTGEYGFGIVHEGLKNGHFEKGEGGAIIFPGEKYGLHNRVFINSLGLPTYETKDFGLAQAKYEDFPYDISYNITGNEINEYFKVVLMALKKVRPELGNKTVHVSHGMVRLPEGKMSSRTGKILRGEWLLDEAKKAVMTILDKNSDFSNEDKSVIAEQIAQAAVKYALLKQNVGENIAFDFEKSISFSGNSGPYLQYTYARARSVLKKSETLSEDREPNGNSNVSNADLSPNSEEMALLKWIYRFPEVILEAGINYSPHIICTYLYELAQRFNSFYNKHSVLQATENKQLRLDLTQAVSITIKNGLKLLGIDAPERM